MAAKHWEHFEWPLIVLSCLICALGLLLIYSASHVQAEGGGDVLIHQIWAIGTGLIAYILCMLLDTSFLRRWSFAIYFVGCVLLLLILFYGTVAGGSRRWLVFGGGRLQPSEPMKLGMILFLARIFSAENAPKDGYGFSKLFLPLGIVALPMLLIAREPDLGTALCYLLIGGSMQLCAGVRRKTVIWLFCICVALSIPSWYLLKDYQRDRILTFVSPERDPRGKGYHALQSKIAVGSGEVLGKGFLKGTQTQLSFLPEQTTDFIFSVLAEEWGFVGSVFLLLLYVFLILRIIEIASRSSEGFPAFVCIGVAAMVFWHVVVNVGMVIGVLPVVGLTLAFVSYGGSSVVTFFAALGLVAGVSRRRFVFA